MTDVVATSTARKRRNGADQAAVLVTGPKLALHFGCVRQHIDQLGA